MPEICLICGKDHPGKVRGGTVGRVNCYRVSMAERFHKRALKSWETVGNGRGLTRTLRVNYHERADWKSA